MKKTFFAALLVFSSLFSGANAIVPIISGTTTLLLQGSPAPGVTGAKFTTIGVPATNNLAQLAFEAGITGINSAATTAIGTANAGIWADDANGIRRLVARTGFSAAGFGLGTVFNAVFSGFSDPVYNNNSIVAFIGTLRIGYPLVTPNNSTGIWSNDGGSLHCVARAGMQAPGLPTGIQFAYFDQLALPDQGGNSNLGVPYEGGVVFLANLSGSGVTAYNKQGIWAVDTTTSSPFLGNLRLVLRQGDPRNGKIIASLSFLSSSPNVAGQTRSFSQTTGDLLIQCTYRDGTWDIVSLYPGLVASYQFLDNVLDSSGLNNNGTATNVAYTDDRIGEPNSALLLNGSNSYVQYPDSVFSFQTLGFTWSTWVLPSWIVLGSTPGCVINHGDYYGAADLMWSGVNSTYSFDVNLGTSGTERYTVNSGPMDTVDFHQIVCVYQKGQQISMYVDGTPIASSSIPNENLYTLGGISPNSAIGALLPNTIITPSSFVGTLTGPGTVSGSGTVTGPGTISGPNSVTVTGTGTVSGTGSATGPGNLAVIGTGTVSGTGTVTGAGTISGPGMITVTGFGTVTGIATVTGPITPQPNPLVSSTTTDFFNGIVDDVQIFNRALSGAEVQQLYTLQATSVTNSVIQLGNPAPGSGGGTFANTGLPTTNNALQIAFKASVTGGSTSTGIWAGDAFWYGQVLIASAGMNAPGAAGAVFSSFSDPVFNDNGGVAFLGTLRIAPGITTPKVPTGTGIWSTDGGVLHLVAQAGQQAPGLAKGVFFTSFSQLVLPNQGGATNTGGVVFLGYAGATQGIWAVDTTGNLQLVFRVGGTLNGKTVSSMTFLAPPPLESGQTRSFSQSTGDLMIKCTLSDGTWAIVRITFP